MTVVIDGTTGIDTIGANTVTSAKIVDGTITASDLAPDATPIGVGQTWQTFTIGTQRVYGTTYTNSTGRPITVSYSSTNASGTVGVAIVASVTIQTYNYGAVVAPNFLSFVVPSGATYSITQTSGSATGPIWAELR